MFGISCQLGPAQGARSAGNGWEVSRGALPQHPRVVALQPQSLVCAQVQQQVTNQLLLDSWGAFYCCPSPPATPELGTQ